ncbi:MAG: four helix bundle protein [Muribaculaceae bacterium]|nr:four helix bundle protein [Muribaculaceae bacterium]
MEFSFEKLVIWQKSRSIVKEVYKIASMFPDQEKYGLSD